MATLRTLLVLATFSSLSACSFLGLDNLPVAGCSTDRDCDGLEAIEPPSDDCHTWQCNPSSMRCEIDVLDADGDGAPAMLSPSMMMCANSGVDCDESDGARYPLNTETCSGTDSDCNGLIDDDAPNLAGSPSCSAVSGAIGSFVVGFTEQDGFPVAETLELTMGSPRLLTHVAFNTAGERLAEPQVVTEAPSSNALLALAPVRSGEWALLRRTGACQPFVQRFRSSSGTLAGPVPSGPECTGERLADLVSDPTQRDRGLLAMLGAGTPSRCEGTTPMPSSLSVNASAASFPAAGDYTVGTSAMLGETTNSVSPVLVAIGGDTYLVALPQSDRSIDVLAITVSAGVASSEVIYTEPARTSLPDLVSLAAGADGEYLLSWSFVCDSGHEARFFTWTASASASPGALVTYPMGPPLQTTAVYQPILEEWLLISESGTVLHGERFDRSGDPIGGTFDIAGQRVGGRVLAQALRTTHAYRIFALRDPITVPPEPEIPDCAALIDVGCLAPE